MSVRTERALLNRLARRQGIQISYTDVRGQRVLTPVDTLRALLKALDIPAGTPEECVASLRAAEAAEAATDIDDVIVAWDGVMPDLCLGHGGALGDAAPEMHIVTEGGFTVPVTTHVLGTARGIGGHAPWSLRYRLRPDVPLPTGYHTLNCTRAGRVTTSLLLCAPSRCYTGEESESRSWGLFAPLYALRSATDFGAGSYTELLEFARGTARLGGQIIGTLPLLPCYCEPRQELSPYLPVSRLLWNEFYIDCEHLPRAEWTELAAQILRDKALAAWHTALRGSHWVDYIGTMRLKESILRLLFESVSSSAAFRADLEAFCATHPHVAPYAVFRATRAALGKEWQDWPDELRGSTTAVGDYNQDGVGLFQFEQWLAHEQMDSCVGHAAANGVDLYLDLPIGVHPEGYDTWQFRDAFVHDVATGAPPDIVFTTGQKWGSPPIHPTAIRKRHYDYVRAYLAHHMRAARMLRIDHVMGLHRMFCIPDGADAAQGTYLRYRPAEWYAMLNIESHRHQTVLVGEDLGLVPREVRRSMTRHGLNSMFVLYYELDGIAAGKPPALPRACLASLNTHDMPPFAAMWQGLDICQHAGIGIVERDQVPSLKHSRTKAMREFTRLLREVCSDIDDNHGLETMLRCALKWLGSSPAKYVVVNIEDLWKETVQQNTPGVGAAYPSWQHRAAMTLEQAWQNSSLRATLEALRHAMRNRH